MPFPTIEDTIEDLLPDEFTGDGEREDDLVPFSPLSTSQFSWRKFTA